MCGGQTTYMRLHGRISILRTAVPAPKREISCVSYVSPYRIVGYVQYSSQRRRKNNFDRVMIIRSRAFLKKDVQKQHLFIVTFVRSASCVRDLLIFLQHRPTPKKKSDHEVPPHSFLSVGETTQPPLILLSPPKHTDRKHKRHPERQPPILFVP